LDHLVTGFISTAFEATFPITPFSSPLATIPSIGSFSQAPVSLLVCALAALTPNVLIATNDVNSIAMKVRAGILFSTLLPLLLNF
jgi:hypothetical protein